MTLFAPLSRSAIGSSVTRATDAEVREAYFDAPLITNRQAKAVPLGITTGRLARILGGKSINSERNNGHGRSQLSVGSRSP